MSITTILETITPKKAEEYLAHNLRNRPLRKHWVETLANAITDGRWHITHQGVAINCNGELIDGQHRLAAIALAGIAVKIYVTRGLPLEAMYGIDQGKTRSAKDCAGVLDLGFEFGHMEVAIARMIMQSMTASECSTRFRATNEQIIGFIAAHQENVSFASGLALGDFNNAPVRAVMARASYTADRDRIREFAEVLRSGMPKGNADSAAVTFRNFYNRLTSTGSNSVRMVIYRKAESALKAFLEFKPLTKIYEVSSELFPMPGEES